MTLSQRATSVASRSRLTFRTTCKPARSPREALCAIAIFAVVAGSACSRPVQYSGVGDVTEVEESGQHVTIRHDAIAGVIDAGTTRFAVQSPELLAGVAPGRRVRFELRTTPGLPTELVLTRAALLDEGQPGFHEHTPHHGGVVTMVGMIHLEAVAEPQGRVRLYVTDVWRRPLPLEQISGSVTLDVPGGKQTLALTAAEGALVASGPALHQSHVNAQFELTVNGQSVEENFALPLAPN